MDAQTANFFVYGTLKRGQCRAALWPHPPVRVLPGWTLGRLFDLGPYPAMLPALAGDALESRVLGEIWQFSPEFEADVVRVLDEIEGTNVPGEANEYDRLRVDAHTLTGNILTVEAYFFARSIDDQLLVPASLQLGSHAYARWPSS